jgi:ribose transport system permease protein|tara:strand:- start:212 stop:1186 length:975 start_codon:yes stop_codon:yes gene_type:complete
VKFLFVHLGVLPFVLLVAIIVFSLMSDNFLSTRNIVNVLRQSTFLTVVAMGQMLALLTGGFDLSVGTILAVTSVVSALAMSGFILSFPDMIWLAISLGILAGLGAGLTIGVINGFGIAFLNVSPFMMTLGMASVGFGIALFLTGGVPVYGMPDAYGSVFGYGLWFSVPVPIVITVCLIVVMYFFLVWTRAGRYLYAIGGNIKAARLSGVRTKFHLFFAYVASAGLASVAGLMLTARLETGEANIGVAMPLESIAACVIAGVSLRGGVGRVESVVLGAIFIGLVQNGMNLARIDSYLQTVVIGVLLISAVIADQIRQKWVADLKG